MKRTKFLSVWALIFALMIYGCSKATTDDPTPTFTIEGDTYKILETKSGLPVCRVNKIAPDNVIVSVKDMVGITTKKLYNLTYDKVYIKLLYKSQIKSFFGDDAFQYQSEFGISGCNLPAEYQVEGLYLKFDGNRIDPEYSFAGPWPTVFTNISKLSK
jgi:hypothetical protein